MKEVAKFYEDFEIGETRTTDARTITETDIVFHVMHSGDFMPHHMDAEFCKTQPFKKPIAHGNMTFSISHGLITEEKITTNQKGEVVCVAHHVIFVEKRNP